MAKNAPKIFSLSCSWRYGRLNAINATLCATLVACAIGIVLAIFSALIQYLLGIAETVTSIAITVVVAVYLPILVLTVYYFRVCILRLHDMNRSGKLIIPIIIINVAGLVVYAVQEFSLLYIIMTIISTIISIALIAIPGTRGANSYGPQPDKGSIAGLVISVILTILSTLLYMVAVALTIEENSEQFLDEYYDQLLEEELKNDKAIIHGYGRHIA